MFLKDGHKYTLAPKMCSRTLNHMVALAIWLLKEKRVWNQAPGKIWIKIVTISVCTMVARQQMLLSLVTNLYLVWIAVTCPLPHFGVHKPLAILCIPHYQSSIYWETGGSAPMVYCCISHYDNNIIVFSHYQLPDLWKAGNEVWEWG